MEFIVIGKGIDLNHHHSIEITTDKYKEISLHSIHQNGVEYIKFNTNDNKIADVTIAGPKL